MKKTQLLDARRTIGREFVAWLSIVVIGMLASLSYLGITYSAATLRKDALRFFNDSELWDLELSATLLFEEEDLEAVRALPGVERAERVYQVSADLLLDGVGRTVTITGVPQTVSVPVLREGRLPERSGECAVESEIMDSCGLTLGQTVRVQCDPVSGVAPLLTDEYRITGVFQTPDHISYMIPATPYLLVPEESFNREGLEGAFMSIRVRVADAPQDRFGPAYWDAVSSVEEAVNALAAERGPRRTESLHGRLEQQLAEGRASLEQARAGLEEAESQLEAARTQLEDAARQIEDGRQLLDGGGGQLRAAAEQLSVGVVLLRLYSAQVQQVLAYIDRGVEWFRANVGEENWPQGIGVSYDEALHWLESDSGELSARVSGLLRSESEQLRQAASQLESARLDWYYMGEEYLDAVTRYEQGMRQFEEGRRRYEESLAQYEQGALRLAEAQETLRQLGDCRWIVLNNKGNAGYLYAEANVRKLLSLSMSFSSIFLIVGALVIYATIVRMLEQQRRLIGVTKALGFYNREIRGKFLIFACSAALLGAALGVLVAWLPLQRTILNSYEALLSYGRGTSSFLPKETGFVVVGALAVSVGAVCLGCAPMLRLPAVRLMQGATPSEGAKKAARSSDRRGLYTRLILLNMRSDLSRVLVTIVSIAGGCLLMVISYTVRYGIEAVPERQYGQIQTYEAEISYSAAENPDAAAELDALLTGRGLPHTAVYKGSGVYALDGELSSYTLFVAEPGQLEGYYRLCDLEGNPITLPGEGALVPRRFWETSGIAVGESVSVVAEDMSTRRLPIAGVFENYYGQIFFMTPQGYEALFGAAPEPNCILVRTQGMELAQLRGLVGGAEGFTQLRDAVEERENLEQITGTLRLVIWIMLFIAAIMACFIVANFTITYLQRKTRELTIMRINGFTVGECIRYAAVDLIVTTVLGTLLGLLLGSVMGRAILSTTETPYLQAVRQPVVQTYLYSALITCGFSLVTNCVALQRVRRLKLSDLS